MAKNKKKTKGKGRKQRQAEKQKLAQMSPEKLISRAEQLLEKGNARDALHCFKQAEKNGASVDGIRPGMLSACLLRHGQLEQKRLYVEADTVMENCFDLLPDPVDLPVDTVKTIIEKAPLEKSVSLYLKRSNGKEAEPDTDRLLANRSVFSQRLDLFDDFPEGLALKQDREVVEKALPLMNRGEWSGAAAALSPLGRKSPYRDIKLFAKLMKAFVENDDLQAAKACSMLSREFPLKAVPRIIQASVDHGQNQMPEDGSETLVALYGKAARKGGSVAQFEQAVSAGEAGKINQAVNRLLPVFSPRNAEHDKMKTQLVQLAGYGLLETDAPFTTLEKLVNKTHPDPETALWLEGKIVSTKYGFFTDYAYDYIDRLSFDFSGQPETDMAKSEILFQMAKILKKQPTVLRAHFDEIMDMMDFFDTEPIAGVQNFRQDELVSIVIIRFAEKALAFDPENRAVCDLLLDLPFEIPSVRKTIEPTVQNMVRTFPNDPLPCLSLAEIYYRKNAFRKAENILQTAFERAPHDMRVKKRYALSYLVAGSRNLARKKMTTVADDFEKAGRFEIQSLKVYVAQKKVMLDLEKTGRFSRKGFDGLTDGFGIEEKLKTLLLLQMELDDPVWSGRFNLRGLQSLFNDLVRQIKTLSSTELASVLAPVPKAYQLLYKDVFPASYLVDAKTRILSNLSNPDMADLIMDFLDNGYEDTVLAELERRHRKLKKKLPADLDFYYVALLHMEDEFYFAPGEFFRILDPLDEKEKEKLRFISRKLAPHASGVMREALELFDFSILEYPVPGPEAAGGGFDSIEELFARMLDMMPDDEEEEEEDPPDTVGFPAESEKRSDLHGLDVDKVFGKTGNQEKITSIIAGVANCAELIVRGDAMVRSASIPAFQEELESLIHVLENDEPRSLDEIRKTGKRLALELADTPYANFIVQAFTISVKRFSEEFSLKEQYFILGMKTEV